MSATNSVKKQFILDTLIPYFEDKSTVAFDKERGLCSYLTIEGKKYAVGKHMKEGSWQDFEGDFVNLTDEMPEYSLKEILTKRAFNTGLSIDEWMAVQNVHDSISDGREAFLARYIDRLELMLRESFDELKQYVKS
jgi:hypothetical protein